MLTVSNPSAENSIKLGIMQLDKVDPYKSIILNTLAEDSTSYAYFIL